MSHRNKSKSKGSFMRDCGQDWDMPPEEDDGNIQAAEFVPPGPSEQNKTLTAVLEAITKLGRKFDHVERLHHDALAKIDNMGKDIRELELAVKNIHDWVLELKSARTRETLDLPGGNIPEGRLH